jgi:hypothetical protein
MFNQLRQNYNVIDFGLESLAVNSSIQFCRLRPLDLDPSHITLPSKITEQNGRRRDQHKSRGHQPSFRPGEARAAAFPTRRIAESFGTETYVHSSALILPSSSLLCESCTGQMLMILSRAEIHDLTEMCFKKCITSSITAGKMASKEETCMANCVNRMFDSNLVILKHLEALRGQQ